jgi:hypothetical protein
MYKVVEENCFICYTTDEHLIVPITILRIFFNNKILDKQFD